MLWYDCIKDFTNKPITGDRIDSLDRLDIVIIGIINIIMLFPEFNSLIREKGFDLRILFGDRLKGEYEKLLEKIRKKKIKVRECSIRVSIPATEIPRESQASNSFCQNQVLGQPECQMPTPTASAEVSLMGEINRNPTGDDELYEEGTDLEHSSDFSDSISDENDNADNVGDGDGDGEVVSDYADDDDGNSTTGDDDILFNLMNIVSSQGGTRQFREEEEFLTSSDVKNKIKQLGNSMVKLASSYDKHKRSYDKMSADMKREMEQFKDSYVLKEDFDKMKRELTLLKESVNNARVELPTTPSPTSEVVETVQLRRSGRNSRRRRID